MAVGGGQGGGLDPARPRLLPACRGLFGRGVTVWAAATSPVGAVLACCRTPPSSGTHAHPVGSLQAGWGLISTPGTIRVVVGGVMILMCQAREEKD